jgi:menaquinone-specific isochorismate synthase
MLDLNPSPPHSLDGTDAVREALADRVAHVLDSRTNGTSRIVRTSVALPREVDPLRWVRAQQEDEAAYWSARDEEGTIAAVGAADVVKSAERPIDYDGLRRQLNERLAHAEAPIRYYGGLRFDASHPKTVGHLDAPWAAFGTLRFVLPRFELHSQGNQTTLVCNLLLPHDGGKKDALFDAIQRLSFPELNTPAPLPAPLDRTDAPDRTGWNEVVRWALDAIADRELDKVVLARRVSLDFGTALGPFRVLQYLRRATPRCFHFAVRPANGAAFIGASPERLFRRTGDQVVSEAVAGTRARGKTDEADAALRDELMQSPKERREHAFVQKAIQADLEKLCTSVEGPDTPSDLALARGRHLHARLTGTLQNGASTLDLLDALHPTPAVGGVPKDRALTAIRSQEHFDRGWYAGPVGWIGPNAAEFAVAIRSGLVQDKRLALFSGAGIVDGSVPEREWDEIEQKIGDFASVLGLDGHAVDAS